MGESLQSKKESTEQTISNLFKRASLKYPGEFKKPPKVFDTDSGWGYRKIMYGKNKYEDGLKRFKNKTIGFFGMRGTIKLEKIVEVLVDIGIAPSSDEARELVPKICNMRFPYLAFFGGYNKFLQVSEIKNSKGNKNYRIETWTDWSE